jgi:hypothetical protein
VLQERNSAVVYAALSALSCVHEDVRHSNAGYLLDGFAPPFLRCA